MFAPRLHLDYETFSKVDIRKTTTSVYTSAPSTEILMLGWAFDDAPVSLWEPRLGPLPEELRQGLNNPGVDLYAFNAPFEDGITRHKLGIDVDFRRWKDTQIKALSRGFPAALDDVLSAIGLEGKNKDGKQLINLFCSPAPKNHKADRYDWENRPAEWERFCGYCRQDVAVERNLDRWLDQSHPGYYPDEMPAFSGLYPTTSRPAPQRTTSAFLL